MTKKRGRPPATGSPRQQKRSRRNTGIPGWLLPAAVVVVLAVIAVVVVAVSQGGSTSSSRPSPTAATGQTVDGIQCETHEQVLFHIHAHLAIFVNGQEEQVPPGIGIPDPQVQQTQGGPFVASGSCFYWLHTHATDGIIHIEAPAQRTFTLGNLYDIWGQPLSASRAGGDTGQVIAYVDGKRFDGDPRTIPLGAHTVIQLDVGTDVPFRPYTFAPNV
ncbi:MAG TPA: hypothetical protein VKF14_05585 [Candidatus Dormibacteraeota bacterium]|nr:hypothetical protein [Candidatus Dormibacteraeota bacterium]